VVVYALLSVVMSLSIINFSSVETFSKKPLKSENMMPSLQPISDKNTSEMSEDLGCDMSEGDLPQFSIRLGGGPQWWF